jgi:hypothetical protein
MQIGLEITNELHTKLTERAKKDGRSLAGEIRYLLFYACEAMELKEKFDKKRNELNLVEEQSA